MQVRPQAGPLSDVSHTLLRALAVGGSAKCYPVRTDEPLPRTSASSIKMSYAQDDRSAPRSALVAVREKSTWAELHLKLLERLAPPSVVVDSDYEIHHISETAGRFLRVGSGVPSSNLLHLIKPELHEELRSLLLRAAHTGEPALSFHVPLVIEGQDARVTIEVSPQSILDGGQVFLLVLFDERPSLRDGSLVKHLEHEAAQLKSQLRDTVEQFGFSTEELKASNEELQATNEELRSATEELETGREELQSVNEELTAINLESKSRVDELAQANSDLQNLMSATAIATIFLDRELKITRFTQTAAPIFNLIAGDIGRPLWHLRSQIRYGNLTADAEQVLQTLSPLEREVQGAGDACYLARMLPYRTLEDRIAGVVLTFVDISERQRAAAALLAQNEQLQRFNQATIGRELRMIELKAEINTLLTRLGEPPRYTIESNQAPAGT
jgi:two-component system, chemotaxis family, CheB/CheR fusion protein